MVNPIRTLLLACIATLLCLTSASAQTPYKLPPKNVVAILDAPPPPLKMLSPTRDALLQVEVQANPSIEVVAAPILRIAGLRINPRVGGLQRLVEYTGLSIQPLDGSPARRSRCRRERVSTAPNGPMTARKSRLPATSMTASSSGSLMRPTARPRRWPARA